jgi:hypothetical protein
MSSSVVSFAIASATAWSIGEAAVVGEAAEAGEAAVAGEGAVPVEAAGAVSDEAGVDASGEAGTAVSAGGAGLPLFPCTSGGTGLKIGAPAPVLGVWMVIGPLPAPAGPEPVGVALASDG